MLSQTRPIFPFLLLLGLLLAALLPARIGHATVRTENAEVELVADRAAVPGSTITVALRLVARPGWHTYWQNPGDTGLPTTIAWTLPEGVTAGTIQWPAPEALPVGPLVNYGYKGEVWLLTDIAVPAGFTGDTLPIRARADWLICEQICVPEGADLDLSVPVLPQGTEAEVDSRHVLGFERSRAALPLPLPEPVIASRAGDRVELLLPQALNVTQARYFPMEDGVAIAAAPQPFDGGRLEFTAESGFKGGRLGGILVVESDGWRRAYVVDSPLSVISMPATVPETPVEPEVDFPLALLFAFLGGIILNLMPCVLPVLSIKAMSFAGRENLRQIRADGLAYTAGVLVCFGVLAGLLLGLRAGGELIGWGFQLQSPLVVGLLTYLFFVLGLWMLDVVSWGGSLMGVGEGLARRGGVAGSFGTGLLAAVVATPCTAPFMGAALGFALTQPPLASMAIFLSLGLGLALPFLLISLVPALARRLPRPGAWMVRLKKLLAFPLFGSVVWLLWVLSVQAGAMAVASAGAGLVVLGFGAFMMREFAGPGGRLTALAALIVAVGLAALPQPQAGAAPVQAGAEAYTPQRLADLRARGQPVFVNLTAAWCITCLVNEQVALERPAVQQILSGGKVTYLIGDWTNRDPAITQLLAQHGRSGVPLYLYYPAGASVPVILPQLLTEGDVLEVLAQP